MEQIADLEIEVLGDIEITGVPGESVLKPHSADIALDGSIYFSDEFNHRIIVINSSGRFIRSIGRRGAGEGEFWYPRGLAVVNCASGPELFVCDAWNHRIQRFTLAGEYIGAFGGIGSGSGEFDEPSEIIALDGAVYILDRCNCRIVKTTPEGAFIEARGFRARIEDELWENDPVSIPFRQDSDPPPYHGYYFPSSFAHAPGYGFIVADTGNRRIKVVTESGALARAIEINPPGGERFHPVSVVYLGEGLALAGDIGGTLHCLVDIAGRRGPVFGKAGWMEVCDRLMAASHDGSALTFSSSQAKLRWIKPAKATVDSLLVHPLILMGLDVKEDIQVGIGDVEHALHILNASIGQCIAAEKDLSASENTYINDILNFHLLQQDHLASRAKGEPSRFKELELAAMSLAFKVKPQLEAIFKLRNRYAESLRDATTLCKALQTDASANSGVKEASERLTGRMMSEYESSMDSLAATSAWLDQNLSNVQSLNAAHSMKAVITILALDFQLRLLKKVIETGGMGKTRFRNPLSPVLQSLKAKLKTPVELTLNGYMCLVEICVERGYYPAAKALTKAMELLQPQNQNMLRLQLASLELQAGDAENSLATIASIGDYPLGRTTIIDIKSAAYVKLGRFDEAVQAMESAIATNSHSKVSRSGLYLNLGNLLQAQGDFAGAMARYEQAIAEAPEQGNMLDIRDKAIIGYARSIMDQCGDIQGAKDWLKQNPTSHINQEEMYFRAFLQEYPENNMEAVEWIDSLLEALPNGPVLRLLAGIIYAMAGKHEKSSAALEWETANFPTLATEAMSAVCARIRGDLWHVLDTVTEEGERLFPHYLERLISSFLLDNQAEIEKSTSLLLLKWKSIHNLSIIVHVTQRQSDTIEKALFWTQEAMKKAGMELVTKRIGESAIWIKINPKPMNM